MKATIIIPLFLFLLTSSVIAQPPVDSAPAGPVTTVEFQNPEYDYGIIEEGDIVTHVFTFTNTGDQPLIISNARGSCGCTVPQWPKDPILPGETASLTVEFNSKGKRGLQNKKVTLTANVPDAQIFLYVKGQVLQPGEGTIEERQAAQQDLPPDPDCFVIAPNPASEVLRIQLDEKRIGQSVQVSIFAPSGQLMADRTIPDAGRVIEFDVAHYPPGVYSAKVQMSDGTMKTECFVISR